METVVLLLFHQTKNITQLVEEEDNKPLCTHALSFSFNSEAVGKNNNRQKFHFLLFYHNYLI